MPRSLRSHPSRSLRSRTPSPARATLGLPASLRSAKGRSFCVPRRRRGTLKASPWPLRGPFGGGLRWFHCATPAVCTTQAAPAPTQPPAGAARKIKYRNRTVCFCRPPRVPSLYPPRKGLRPARRVPSLTRRVGSPRPRAAGACGVGALSCSVGAGRCVVARLVFVVRAVFVLVRVLVGWGPWWGPRVFWACWVFRSGFGLLSVSSAVRCVFWLRWRSRCLRVGRGCWSSGARRLLPPFRGARLFSLPPRFAASRALRRGFFGR